MESAAAELAAAESATAQAAEAAVVELAQRQVTDASADEHEAADTARAMAYSTAANAAVKPAHSKNEPLAWPAAMPARDSFWQLAKLEIHSGCVQAQLLHGCCDVSTHSCQATTARAEGWVGN